MDASRERADVGTDGDADRGRGRSCGCREEVADFLEEVDSEGDDGLGVNLVWFSGILLSVGLERPFCVANVLWSRCGSGGATLDESEVLLYKEADGSMAVLSFGCCQEDAL